MTYTVKLKQQCCEYCDERGLILAIKVTTTRYETNWQTPSPSIKSRKCENRQRVHQEKAA